VADHAPNFSQSIASLSSVSNSTGIASSYFAAVPVTADFIFGGSNWSWLTASK
jgi:hypothetical protein